MEPPHSPAAADGAVYCWPAQLRDPQQTGVDRQELLGRKAAALTGVTVRARHVYVDSHLSAWSSDRALPGWDAMVAAVRAGEFGHLFLHRPADLLRRPRLLDELLRAADRADLVLHGDADGLDLGDPAQRRIFQDRTTKACRTADRRSRKAKDSHQQAAAAGQPHGGGRRRYGYTAGMTDLIEAEAAIVREIFSRFLTGDPAHTPSLRALTLDLNQRGIPTAGGGRWTVGGVARIIDAPRYAGLRIVRGKPARNDDGSYVLANWPAVVSIADWENAQLKRAELAQAASAARRPDAEYPLTGLVRCARCERHMVGSAIAGFRTYACTTPSRLQPQPCSRRIAAQSLETHMEQEALRVLRTLEDGFDPQLALVTTPVATPHPDAPRTVRAAHQTVVVRAADALDGVPTGPDAERTWHQLSPARRTAVVRFLFPTIRIEASSTSRSVFDPTRVHATPNPVGGGAPGR
ncbi:recombinase family protein [Kitasatospora sp. MAP5-34]|uniref:recombinase family protein n=1 Tax=Kitasatospora sp. MAP5-34 TaxID=3035102 RepID=UPI00247441B2|nr:recombinase family protein [Kitasatospora sp. MAP5-34]MDH6579126.1 site-specific DNA recombinase [Kitasatospora sp. MAP5-34]